jgi:MFS family permease
LTFREQAIEEARVVRPAATGKWAVVGMLWCVCFFNYADRQSIFSVFPVLRQEFGFDAVQLGLVGSAFMWVYAAGSPLAGFIADRLPRKHLILGGCLFWSSITVTTAWCSRLWQFVTVRALEGFGETCYFPSTVSLISDYHGRRTRSRALSLHQSGVYIGTIGGSFLGAWFAEHLGWRTGFYFFGGAGLVLALVLYRFLKEPARGGAEARESGALGPAPPASAPAPSLAEIVPLVLGKPTALLLMAAFLGANFVATIFLTWTPTFLFEKFGFALTSAGLTGAVFIHLASAASAPAGGVLADRLARRMAGGRMVVQASGLLAGATFVALVGLTADVTTLVVAMTLFGICKGLYDSNIFASLYDVIEPRARATAAGLMNTVGWGGGALGPVAVGLATKYGRHVAAGTSESARRAAEVANMSEAIACGAIIYVLAAALLVVAALVFARRDAIASAVQSR